MHQAEATELNLTAFRSKASLALASVALVLLSPFAVNNLIQNRFLLGFGSFAVITLMGINAWCIWRKNLYQPWLIWGLVPSIAGYLILSFKYQGVVAAFWAYPAVIMFYFMLPEKHGRLANLVFLCMIFPAAKAYLPISLLVRVMVTLTAVSAFTAITMRLVYSQHGDLERQALMDPLTGLLNRTTLSCALQRALHQFDRTGIPMSLLCLDVDHFKSINDTYGHAVGDHVLTGLSDVLRERIRATDLVYRLGGEEFLVLLHNCDERGARILAEDIRLRIRVECSLAERVVTTSVGTSTLKADDSRHCWLKRGDQCLYEAKRRGRNRVVSQGELLVEIESV